MATSSEHSTESGGGAPAADALLTLKKEDCIYTSCYCEENVWCMAKSVADGGGDLSQFYAVFISNITKSVAVWRQKASGSPDGLVVWDYHVIFIQKQPSGESRVFDLDTTLPGFPVPFSTYFIEAFKPEMSLQRQYRQAFRVVPASEFLASFSSDRSHMREADGGWKAPPPSYPAIQADGVATNLNAYMDMTPRSHPDKGVVMSLKELAAFFGSPKGI